jgi:uncharacterized protein YcfJ
MHTRPHLKALAFGLVIASAAATASAQVTFFEHDDFGGRSFSTTRQIANFQRYGFNDRASSVEVQRHRWEACQDVRFGGRCVVLQPGRYPSLAAMGLNDRVSSVRQIGDNVSIADDRFAPLPAYDARRRQNERLFEAKVSSVRAVMGPPETRCWSEPEQVRQEDREANVPRALLGAVIGGILGHQIGGGTGRDVATVGGAVAGGVLGGRSGRDSHVETRDVQHCATTAATGRPAYWDVSYRFRGQDHRIQMTKPPGETVSVNRLGEPRV